jgi:uncharacterized protein YebE (UPF0316 family)
MPNFFTSDLYAWVILPLIIFSARVMDVTLGTLRIIFIARGKRYLAPVLGFFEVLIWIVVISQIVQNLHNAVAYIAYAAGFATGSFIGITLEDKLAIGTLIVRVIIPDTAGALIARLQAAGYGVTSVDAHGATGAVTLIYTVVLRKSLPEVTSLIHATHPNAFLSIEEVRATQAGIFPARPTRERWVPFKQKRK